MSVKVNLPSFQELSAVFTDEISARRYLQDAKVLLTPGMLCPCCSQGRLGLCGAPSKARCGRNACRKKYSIFTGSFFQGSKLPTNVILHLCWDLLAGATVSQIVTKHKVSTETATAWCGYFRDLLTEDAVDGVQERKIGGPNVIVEVDESKFGKRRYNRGHRVDGVWVIGGVERTPYRRCFVKVVEDRTAETIRDLLEKHIAPGSIIYTDCWKGYRTRDLEDLGFEHCTVNHNECFKDPITGVHTNTIEGTWNGIKVRVPSRHRTNKFVTGHLMTFCWKRCFGLQAWERFLNALHRIRYVSFDNAASVVNDENAELNIRSDCSVMSAEL